MIVVGICTYRRPSLADTLASLRSQTRAPDLVVVADNDETPTARRLVAEAGQGLPLRYRHAPSRNVSVARNACLAEGEGAKLAFIDDDETAPPGWLAALEAAMTPGIAAVFGPSCAVYPETAPGWLASLDAHSQVPVKRGGAYRTGHTASCLIDLAHPALAGLRFDPRFGGGGEDADYFRRGHTAGATYAYAEQAVVFERVPAERLSLRWLLRRKHLAGRTYYAGSGAAKGRMAVAASAKLAWCLGSAVRPSREARARALVRGAVHAGVVSAALAELRP